MNIEEIQELKRGDLVRDRVTGAIFRSMPSGLLSGRARGGGLCKYSR